ncbi:conserved hypothetical protein [Nesidiocoris tenuis]|uniref:PHD-type domain-containing protein n=1 Tax=Nesidiocoris tenuis TaxID=355587 RepID=A0ABN7AJK8_9HEMI|nr:conserved hypothetical protein [Nesidiocoris tenuis]
MSCNLCESDLGSPHNKKKTAVCYGCKKSWHIRCISSTKERENYQKLKIESRSQWRCNTCKTAKLAAVGAISDEPDGSEHECSDSDGTGRILAKPGDGSDTQQLASDIKALLKTVNKINVKVDKIPSIEHQLSEMSTSLDFMNEKYEAFLSDMKVLQEKVTTLNTENRNLKETVAVLQLKVDHLEQDTRKANIELHCIPETPNENCAEIVKSVGNLIGRQISPKFAHRVGVHQRGQPRVILAGTESSTERENFVNAARKNKDYLRSTKLHTSWPDARFFVNENLTSYRKQLLRRTKDIAKEKGVQFVWTRDFKILTRKEENAKVKIISNETDLLNL